MNKEVSLTKRQEKQLDLLYKRLKKDYEVDIMLNTRKGELVRYRSIFNTIAVRLYNVQYCTLSRYYKSKNKNFSSGSIGNSVSSFKRFCFDFPEIDTAFKKLAPELNKVKPKIREYKDLTPIQKLVTGLTKEEENELIEMIELRKKSWLWKNN